MEWVANNSALKVQRLIAQSDGLELAAVHEKCYFGAAAAVAVVAAAAATTVKAAVAAAVLVAATVAVAAAAVVAQLKLHVFP